MINAWFENYTSEELPPEHLWLDPESLNTWFTQVKMARDAKYNTGGGASTELVEDPDKEYVGNPAADQVVRMMQQKSRKR